MKSSVRHCIQLYATLLCFAPYSFAADVVVQHGDTLSQIFYRQYNVSLYRSPDWIEKIHRQNPHLKSPHIILPGQILHFDLDDPQLVSQPSHSTDSVPRGIASENAESIPQVLPSSPDAPVLPLQNVLVPTEKVKSDERQTAGLSVKAGFEYFRIESKDQTTGQESVFLSNLNPQVRVRWDFVAADWTYLSQLNLMTYDLQNDQRNPNTTMERQKDSRYGFVFGAERRWVSGHRSGLHLTYQERLFFHALAADRLSADRVGSFGLNLQHEMDLFHIRKAHGGLLLSGQIALPGQGPGYSTKLGQGGELQFFFRHPLRNWTMDTSLYYGLMKQDSDLVQQTESHLGVLWGVTWNFED